MLKRTLCAGILLASSLAPASAQDASARIVERYRQILEANPSPGTALDRLWKIFQDRSDTAGLLEIYKQDETFAGQILYGQFLRKAGKLEDAARAFAKAAEIDPKRPSAHLALANLAKEQGRPMEAARQFSIAAEMLPSGDSSLSEILLKLGDSYAAGGEPEKAAKAWERAVTLKPGNIQLRRQLAQSYVNNDLPELAIPHYQYIEKNGSVYEQAIALRELAEVQQTLGNQNAAIESLERGIRLTAPGNWLREELQTQLIRLHQRLGRADELEKKWRNAVEKNPRDLGAYLQLLALYRQLDDQQKQQKLLEKLVALSPRNLDFKIWLARLVEQSGNSAGAAKLFDEILEAQPGNVTASLARASIDLQQGRVREASDRVETLLTGHPGDETIRERAMDFFTRHRLYKNLEKQLRAAANNQEGLLTLARFLFERGRPDEARATLSGYLESISAPGERAEVCQRVAQLYRDQGDFQRAIESLENAVQLRPESMDILLAFGDLYIASGNLAQARLAIEKAYNLAGNDAAREQADQALFQAFESNLRKDAYGSGNSGKRPQLLDGHGRINLFAAPLPGPHADGENADKELIEFVNSLVASAEKSGKVEDWLRAARWQMHAQRYDLAMQAAGSALQIEPDSVPVRQTIVKIATLSGLTDVAGTQLKSLAKLDPENATRYQKQLADLQLASGDIESALKLYQSLAESNPGDIERLADLALATQQSGRWDESLKLWRKAYEMSSPTQRKSVIPPLKYALEHSGRSLEAANLLLESVDSQNDEPARLEAFRDLLAFATENNLREWLREEFERRHRRRPNDYFTEVALSHILKAQGLDRESFELLRTAAYAAPDPVDAFQQLAREAEALGYIEAAVEAQKRLISLRGDESSESLQRLAVIQTNALKIGDAHETWKKLVERNPRDLEILRDSAAFFARWRYDDDAISALRTARALDPHEVATLMLLAKIAERSGGNAEALSCYDQILRTIPAPGPASNDDLIVPDVPETDPFQTQRNFMAAARRRGGITRFGTAPMVRSLWNFDDLSTLSNAEQRLEAIRGAGSILTKKGLEAQRKGWLNEWGRRTDASQNEKLWAFYSANDRAETLNLLQRMIRNDPEDPYVAQAFIWLAFRMKGYKELAAWLENPDRRPQDRDLLAIVLGQYLNANPGAVDPDLMSTLFPPDYGVRQMTWQAAVLLADAGHFREAAILGERVVANAIANRAIYGTELSYWYLLLGDRANAKRMLETSIEGQTGDMPDAPVFEALRRYFYLLPPGERSTFVKTFISGMGKNTPPVHSAIARALLCGLSRNLAGAGRAILDLYHLHALSYDQDYDGGATYRAWSFLLAAGMQFQQWNLDGLAGALWDRALRDQAALRLDGRQAATLAQDIRVRLAANDLVTMPPLQGRVRLGEFLSEDTEKLATSLASILEATGYPQYSIRIYRDLLETDDPGIRHLRALVNACRAAKAYSIATDTLIDSMQNTMSRSNTAVYRDSVLQFANFLIGEKEFSDASRLLDAAEEQMPDDPMVLERKARVASQLGDPARAELLYRKLMTSLPGNFQTRLLLAGALDEQGKTREAIALLEEVSPESAIQSYDTALAALYLEVDELDRAETIIRRLVGASAFDPVAGLAESLANHGRSREAQRIFYSISEQLKNDDNEFVWQAKLLEVISPLDSPDLFRRVALQLRDGAAENPDHWNDYLETRDRIAQRYGLGDEFRSEVESIWEEGNGPFAAGAKLVELYALAGQESEATAALTSLLKHPDYDETLLENLATQFAKAGDTVLATEIATKVSERNPLSAELALKAVELMNKAGRRSDAAALLEKLSACAVVNPELAGKVGMAYHAMGLKAEAEHAYKLAVELDPYARRYRDYVNYAKLLMEVGDLPEARRVLRYSFRNPANSEVGVLVDLVAAEGALSLGEDSIVDFQLAPQNLGNFRREAARRSAPR